ncbi:MAG: YicC family protein [Proteobacteria bacterium]|nr:YicC family protein [Pseudomonadota bacterium]
MLESMTAYGFSEVDINNTRFTIEIKSVNHRFFEARIKMPYSMAKIDPAIRKILKDKLIRGSVDCYIRPAKICQEECSGTEAVIVDYNLLSQYIKAIDDVKLKFKLQDAVKISDILRIPNIFVTEERNFSDEELGKKLLSAIEKCSDSVIEMQKKEGSALKTVIDKNLLTIEDYISKIIDGSKDLLEHTLDKIKEKLVKLLSNTEISEDRILTEAGILAERFDISEEIDRLKSHIKQFRDETNKSTDVGRKLDFIVQEINREINTIASKAEEKDIVYCCVESKAVIEKIREQIQNVK